MDFRFLEGKVLSLIYIFYIILAVLSLVSFSFTIVNYIRSIQITESVEQEDPDIYITGLKKVEFNHKLESEYHEGMSNLGNTGDIKINCFLGTCKYDFKKLCKFTDWVSESTYDDDEVVLGYYVHEEKMCSNRRTEYQHTCSAGCRLNRHETCGSFYCRGNDYNYVYISSSCSKIDSDEENPHKSCGADNLILFWKQLNYKSSNYSTYGTYKYSTNAISSKEKCEDTGRKNCGILDNLGNKLCLPKDAECPINLVTTKSEIIEKYQHFYTINLNDKKIYYTNEAVNEGKIIEGFYVDSDLLIKYPGPECEIIDTWTISELMYTNPNKLYQESLDYDPYEDDKIDSKGKSYLKICSPGIGKDKNIDMIKKKIKDKENSDSFNDDYVHPIKVIFNISFFVSLIGYILLFSFLVIFICSFLRQRDCMSKFLFLGCYENQNCCIIILSIISSAIILAGAIVSMFNIPNFSSLDSGEINVEVDKSSYDSLKISTFISFGLSIILVICSVLYIFYLKYAGSLSSDSNFGKNISMKLVNNPSKQE